MSALPQCKMMHTFWVSLIFPLVSAVTVPISLSAGGAPSVDGNLISLSIEQDREYCPQSFIFSSYTRIQGGLIGLGIPLATLFFSIRSTI